MTFNRLRSYIIGLVFTNRSQSFETYKNTLFDSLEFIDFSQNGTRTTRNYLVNTFAVELRIVSHNFDTERLH